MDSSSSGQIIDLDEYRRRVQQRPDYFLWNIRSSWNIQRRRKRAQDRKKEQERAAANNALIYSLGLRRNKKSDKLT